MCVYCTKPEGERGRKINASRAMQSPTVPPNPLYAIIIHEPRKRGLSLEKRLEGMEIQQIENCCASKSPRSINHICAIMTSILSKDLAQLGHLRMRLAMRSSTQLLQKRWPQVFKMVFLKSFRHMVQSARVWEH